MRIFRVLALAVAAFALSACGSHSASDGSSGVGPTNPLSGNGSGNSPPPTTLHPLFSISQGVLPYPTDLYFNGSTDGTLRLPTGLSTLPNAVAINNLDGFSTISPITVRFSAPIDPTTLTPYNVVVIRLTLDNATKGPLLPPAAGAQLPKALAYGQDYIAYVSGAGPANALSQQLDSNGSTLVIEPTHPLDASSGATNIGYIVLLTNGIKDTSGNAAVPDRDYATVQQGALADLAAGKTTPTCASVTDATLNLVCQLTFGHLAIAAQGGLDPTKVVLSFSFSTESTSDTLNVLATTYEATPVAPGTIAVAPTGQTTKEFLAAAGVTSPGYADIYAGIVTLPYYLTAAANPHDTAPVTKYWTAAGASPAPGVDPASRKLTRFNPVPLKTTDVTVPVLVGVPDAARTPCVEPAAGWPVVVFQHGITGNRSQALAIFDAYTSHCFVIVAIDQPLHGITDPTSPLYRNQLFAGSPAAGLMTGERTFDLDLVNNTTGAPGPDGVIDSSGTSYINLTSLLTQRDDLRQSESDLLWLGHVLPTLSLGANKNGTSDVDKTSIQFASVSLGSIVGIPAMGVISVANGQPNSPYKSAALSVPGGGFAYIARDSATFGPIINAGLKANSGGLLLPGTTLYDNFVRDAQTIIDAGDPVNFVASAVAGRPLLMQQVVGGGMLPDSTAALPDQVVPNSSTARLIAAGKFARFSAPGQSILAPGSGAYVNFIFGQHGSIETPAGTSNTAASNAAVFFEMQTEAVAFALASGQAVTIANPTVVQP